MRTRFLSRRHVTALAGGLWFIASAVLLVRGIGWLLPTTGTVTVELLTASLILAPVGYRLGFRRVVRINLERIASLPEPLAPWSILSGRGLMMIAGMMTLGILLRRSALPTAYLVIPYLAMGTMLMAGAVELFRRSSSGADGLNQRTQNEERT